MPKNKESKVEVFHPLGDFDGIVDDIEKSYALTGSSFSPNEKRQTTGLLSLDLVLGGGIIPGWYTTYGPEQSCKSTLTMTMMCASVHASIVARSIWDFEGSTQPDYVSNILKTMRIDTPVEEVFGLRDPKTQNWIIKPKVRYYSENIGEKFFDYLAKLERLLPDKRLIKDEWFYIYVNTKANKALVGKNYDQRYFSKTGMFKVPAEDGRLQGLLLPDSYPAMLPETQDVDDPNSAIAVQARMFSDQLRRVKGKLRAKRIAVLGVNQLRKVPMVMYGPTEQEPCGEALRFYSDVRLKATPRSLKGCPISAFHGKGMIMEEPSVTVDGGLDKYRFIHIKAIKNKLSMPYLETWLRLWIEDAEGEARGFDPVWDLFWYLRETGQISGNVKKLTFNLHKGPTFEKRVTWLGFKTLVLANKTVQRETLAELGCSKEKFDLRAFCCAQRESGTAMDLYLEHRKEGLKEKAPKASDEKDD